MYSPYLDAGSMIFSSELCSLSSLEGVSRLVWTSTSTMEGFKYLSLTLMGFVVLLGAVKGQINDIAHMETMGKIKGSPAVTSKDQEEYVTFHGIPYADPSSYTGANRFRPSKIFDTPLTTDDSVWPANKLFVVCPQDEIFNLDAIIPDPTDPESFAQQDYNLVNETLVNMYQDLPTIFRKQHQKKRLWSKKLRSVATTQERIDLIRREDDDYMGIEECLTININTPRVPAEGETDGELYPVVVFYHGGGSDSVWGSAFTALRMLEHKQKVLLVTMNYRLGVLGALNLGTNDAPGNAAMYDAVTCLQWIKKNIKAFGGNPDKITITGQSAGSMMVTNLLISPMTEGKDLFHGVWGFSGSAISVWAVSEHPSVPKHLRIAELAECQIEPLDIRNVTRCMQNAPLERLVVALRVWKHEEEAEGRLGYDARMPSIQAPGLDAEPGFEYFMPKHPFEALENLEQRQVPVVLGATRHDGSYPLDDIYNNFIKPNGYDKNPEFLKNEMLPFLLRVLGIKDDTGELYHAMARDFFGNSSTTPTWEDKMPGMLDMVTTMAFKAGSYEILHSMYKQNNKTKAYFYSMDYVGRWSLYNFLWGDMYVPGGICHTDDLIYFFWLGPLLNDDMRVSRRWMEYFINFAYYGDVNGDFKSKEYNEFWKSYDPIDHNWMQLSLKDHPLTNAPDYFMGAAAELFEDWAPPVDEGSSTTPETPPTDPTDPSPTGSSPTDPTGTTPTGSSPTDPTGTTPTGSSPTDPTGTTSTGSSPTDPTGTTPTGSTQTSSSTTPASTTSKSSQLKESLVPIFVISIASYLRHIL